MGIVRALISDTKKITIHEYTPHDVTTTVEKFDDVFHYIK